MVDHHSEEFCELKRLVTEAIVNRFSKNRVANMGPYDQVTEYLLEHGVTVDQAKLKKCQDVPVYTVEELASKAKDEASV